MTTQTNTADLITGTAGETIPTSVLTNRAYSAVWAYLRTQNPAGIDSIEVAESSRDAEDYTAEALDEDRGDAALKALVEDFGGEAWHAINGVFARFIDDCVEEAEQIEAREQRHAQPAQERLAAAIAKLSVLRALAEEPEACRAAAALHNYLLSWDEMDEDDTHECLDVITHGVNREGPDYYFDHLFGEEDHLCHSSTLAHTKTVEGHIADIESGEIDPANWWEDEWDAEAREKERQAEEDNEAACVAWLEEQGEAYR